MNTQRRSFTLDAHLALEKRADGAGQMLVGHAAVFNELSEDLGFFREMIMPGAFRKSIAADDIRALWNHDTNWPLGRNRAGTLRLSEDEVGLRIEIDPPDTSVARDALVSIGRGDITQMSFAFDALQEAWDYNQDPWLRKLLECKLWEVSPVTFPAYPATDVGVRKITAPPAEHPFTEGRGAGVACSSCSFGPAAPWHQVAGVPLSVRKRAVQVALTD